MLRLPFWPPIHKLLVQQQQFIKKLFLLAYIVSVIFIAMGFFIFSTSLSTYILLSELAGNIGTISLLLFLGSLLPGIFKRFAVLPVFSASIVLFRRQIGILMYFTALIHSMYLVTIPAIMNQALGIANLPPNGLTGVIALSILFPVWITSNDISQKNLGKWWKRIQRLTYLAIVFIFFHVALVETSAAIISAVVFILLIVSWIKVWVFKPKQVSPQTSQPVSK